MKHEAAHVGAESGQHRPRCRQVPRSELHKEKLVPTTKPKRETRTTPVCGPHKPPTAEPARPVIALTLDTETGEVSEGILARFGQVPDDFDQLVESV